MTTTLNHQTPVVEPPPPAHAGGSRSRMRGWQRWALAALLVATALLYLVGLSSNGWANSYYSAAVQAGADSWSAFFFGSSDAANSITVDKPPASLWVMVLSVRLFGLNSWAMLVPQALMGVASVGVLFATVRRWYGTNAGLLAAAMLALTPAATLMFRFNNPDALLVLLLVLAAYATVRAIERASTAWLLLASALVGFGFLTKMLQAFLIVPAIAVAYLVAAPTSFWRRLLDMALGGLAMLVAGGWWVTVVELLPASARPYVGGSQTNSVVELVFGYNGIGRLTGNETGAAGAPVGGAAGGRGGFGGDAGFGRLLESGWSGYIGWLLPAAAILLIGMLWLTRSRARTDHIRAGALLWGGWALVTWAVFSFSSGIIHEYYSVALAPALAAVVAAGITVLWRARGQLWARLWLVGSLLIAAMTSLWITALAGGWYAWIGLASGLITGVAALAIAAPIPVAAQRAALIAACAALLVGPLTFSLQTAATAQSGSLPTAGPALAGTSGLAAGPGAGAPVGADGGGGAGGLLDASSPSAAMVQLLTDDADAYTWVAAAVGAQTAAGYQLAADAPVMAIGGFNGSDPSPTLAEFQQLVADGEVHYFIAGGDFPSSPDGGHDSSEIADWVAANFASNDIAGVSVYDLSGTG